MTWQQQSEACSPTLTQTISIKMSSLVYEHISNFPLSKGFQFEDPALFFALAMRVLARQH